MPPPAHGTRRRDRAADLEVQKGRTVIGRVISALRWPRRAQEDRRRLRVSYRPSGACHLHRTNL